jgi:hypothetical protein
VNQSLFGSVGQSRDTLQIFAQIMCVGVDSQQIDVNGKCEIVGDEEIAVARRDIELVIIFHLNKHGMERRGFIREIEPKARLQCFRFAGRLKMRVQDEVVIFVQADGHPVRFDVGS